MVDEPQTPQIDQEKINQAAIKAAQDALISKITDNKPKFSWEERGKDAPSNYDELFQEVEKRMPNISPEEIDKRVEERLKQEREREAKLKEEETKKKQLSVEEQRKNLDKEWYELVQDGKMPEVAKELQERINKGEQLTKEEIEADEGLKARLELIELAYSSGKSAKLAFYEDYQNREPAGAKAPVLGGRTPVGGDSEELKYEDVVANRKKMFGF